MDDRISQLPEDIAHHVLSFLNNSPKALVRMSVLSKYWFAITASFPILHFDIDSFTRDVDAPVILDDVSHVRNMFYKYVEYTTSRFCNQQNIVHTFNLNGERIDNPLQLSIVDTCIGLILRKGGLQALKIILSSLIIKQKWELPWSLMVDDAIKLKSLKLLHLECVNINDQVIQRLTTCCPLLEEFKLVYCYGFKRFCINGIQNLQKVSLEFDKEVERIDIDAPNLWYLYLKDGDYLGAPCMKLSSCKKLTTLSYHGELEGSTDFLSNFPYIENLYLRTIHLGRRNLKLSSYSLKTLVFYSYGGLDVIDIDAPNLVLFKYDMFCFESVPLVRYSAKSEAQIEWFPIIKDASSFKDLRRFVNKTNGFFKVLKLNFYSSYIDVEELKVIDSPPVELEHAEVELGSLPELVNVAAVDAVLWCLRPQSLTLKSDFYFLDVEKRRRLVKLIYEKLLQQEDEGRTGIQIELSISSSKSKKRFNDLNSLLEALPRDRVRHIITLTKVEDLNSCRSSNRMHEIQEPVSAESCMRIA